MFNSPNRYVRGMVASIVIIGLSAFNFINLDGHENVRTLHIVTLLVCGMGIGILMINLIAWFRTSRK